MKGRGKAAIFLATVLFVSVWAGSVRAQDGELSGRDIAVMVDERPDGDDRQGTMTLTLINHRGSRRVRTVTFRAKEYEAELRTLMVFTHPADVADTGFLQIEYDDPSREDDRWLYLPAMRRARRISGSARRDYFMGTDFTYDDMGDRVVDEDTHTLLREEGLDGHACWVLESVPNEENHMYSKRICWIRQDVLLAIKVEFYGRDGELMKVLTVGDIREVDGFWVAFRMEMDNRAENHRTVIEMDEMSFNNGLSDSVFRVSTLERGRTR